MLQSCIRLFLTALFVWTGTGTVSFAIKPLTVDIKPFCEGFVMARSDGMIIWTDIDGNAVDSIRLDMDIAGIDVSEGALVAVSPDCTIMSVERSGKFSQKCSGMTVSNSARVVGVAISRDNILILTDSGTILSTKDFDDFSSLDFNSIYSGYYDEVQFCAVAASDNYFYIAGVYRNGMPAVFTSATGKVWSERTLSYTENRENLELEQQPLGLAYDRYMDRFVMACTDGYVFYMPGCSHCNSIERKSYRDIGAVGFNEGRCLFVNN